MKYVFNQMYHFFFVSICVTLLFQNCTNTHDELFYNSVAIIDSTSFYSLKLLSTVNGAGSGSFASMAYEKVQMYLVKLSMIDRQIIDERLLQDELSLPSSSKLLYTEPWIAYICERNDYELWIYNEKSNENIKVDEEVQLTPLFLSSKGNFLGYKKEMYYIYDIKQKRILTTFNNLIRPFYYDEKRNEIHVIIADKNINNNIMAIYDVSKGILRDSIQTAYMVDCTVDRGERIVLFKNGTTGHVLTLVDSVPQ